MMPWWGYIILIAVCIGIVAVMAMILSDTDDVLEPKNGDSRKK